VDKYPLTLPQNPTEHVGPPSASHTTKIEEWDPWTPNWPSPLPFPSLTTGLSEQPSELAQSTGHVVEQLFDLASEHVVVVAVLVGLGLQILLGICLFKLRAAFMPKQPTEQGQRLKEDQASSTESGQSQDNGTQIQAATQEQITQTESTGEDKTTQLADAELNKDTRTPNANISDTTENADLKKQLASLQETNQFLVKQNQALQTDTQRVLQELGLSCEPAEGAASAIINYIEIKQEFAKKAQKACTYKNEQLRKRLVEQHKDHEALKQSYRVLEGEKDDLKEEKEVFEGLVDHDKALENRIESLNYSWIDLIKVLSESLPVFNFAGGSVDDDMPRETFNRLLKSRTTSLSIYARF
jgi:hypothetical protein